MNSDRQIRLRAMEPEDLDLLYQIENDRSLWDVGTNNVPYSRYVLHHYMASNTGDIYSDKQVRLVIENGVGQTVGLADLTNFDAKNCRAEVGIAILSTQRNRGYGGMALSRMAEYASQVLHLHQLYAVIDTGNQESLQLFSHAGYQTAATLDDWLYDGKKFHKAMLMQIFL